MRCAFHMGFVLLFTCLRLRAWCPGFQCPKLRPTCLRGVQFDPYWKFAIFWWVWSHFYLIFSGNVGQSCLWFSDGCSIGCAKCDGLGGNPNTRDRCNSGMNATLCDPKLRTYNQDAPCNTAADLYRHNPWRAPGASTQYLDRHRRSTGVSTISPRISGIFPALRGSVLTPFEFSGRAS